MLYAITLCKCVIHDNCRYMGLNYLCRNGMKLRHLNLDRLQYFIDSGRIDPNETITMRVLRMSGAVSGKMLDGVKLLGIVCFILLLNFINHSILLTIQFYLLFFLFFSFTIFLGTVAPSVD